MKRKDVFSLLFGLTTGIIVLFCGLIAVRSLRNATAVLHPARKPVLHPDLRPELAGMQDVSLQTSDKVTLRGWYVPTRNGATIVLMHGVGENRMQMLFHASVLTRHGYGVLLFDWRAHGESDGELVTWGTKEQDDLRAALDFLSRRKEVDTRLIGAVGLSMGGITTVHVASTDRRLSAMVLEGTYTSLPDIIRDDFGKWGVLSRLPAQWAFRHAGIPIDSVNTVKAIPSLSPRPLLFVNGDSMVEVPIPIQNQLYEAARQPKELWRVHGANHGDYGQVAPKEYEQRLIAFFDAALLKRLPETSPN